MEFIIGLLIGPFVYSYIALTYLIAQILVSIYYFLDPAAPGIHLSVGRWRAGYSVAAACPL